MTTQTTSPDRPGMTARISRAWRAFRELTRNPEDLAPIGEIFEALGDARDERLLRRMLAHAGGETILRRPTPLAEILADRTGLAALPEGSLGRAYLDFMIREEISTESLMELSRDLSSDIFPDPATATDEADALGAALQARLFASHDLMHVVTGYGRDLVGEAALLAFTYAQTKTRPVGFIVAAILALTYLRLPPALSSRMLVAAPPGFEQRENVLALRRAMQGAYRLGRKAAWLPAADWEALLECRLSDVRGHLGLEVPRYEPIRSEGAPILDAA